MLAKRDDDVQKNDLEEAVSSFIDPLDPDLLALQELAAVLAEVGLAPEQLIILSFSDEVVTQARHLLPEVKTLWITDYTRDWRCGGWQPSVGEVLRTLERTGATGLASQARRCSASASGSSVSTAIPASLQVSQPSERKAGPAPSARCRVKASWKALAAQ